MVLICGWIGTHADPIMASQFGWPFSARPSQLLERVHTSPEKKNDSHNWAHNSLSRIRLLLWSLCVGIQVNIPANTFMCNTIPTHTYFCMWHYVHVFLMKIPLDTYWNVCRYVHLSLIKIYAETCRYKQAFFMGDLLPIKTALRHCLSRRTKQGRLHRVEQAPALRPPRRLPSIRWPDQRLLRPLPQPENC